MSGEVYTAFEDFKIGKKPFRGLKVGEYMHGIGTFPPDGGEQVHVLVTALETGKGIDVRPFENFDGKSVVISTDNLPYKIEKRRNTKAKSGRPFYIKPT